MDSYDLFGEDGTGMLEGLADLGSDNFDDNAAPVGGAPRDAPNQPGLVLAAFSNLLFILLLRGRRKTIILCYRGFIQLQSNSFNRHKNTIFLTLYV